MGKSVDLGFLLLISYIISPSYCCYGIKQQTNKQTKILALQVMVAEALDIARETYFAILMDREYSGPVLVGSPFGGVNIEEVAEKNPEAIFKVFI